MSSSKGQVVPVPAEVVDRIERVAQACILRAQMELGYKPLAMPNVIYTKRGTTAGTARHSTNTININSVLLMENLESMINETVPHEVAHLIAGKIYGPHIKPHGVEWQKVMRALGKEPTRCHSYDTTNSRVRKRRRFVYTCSCSKCVVGATVHKRIQSGSTHYCKNCRSRLYGLPFREEAQ